ncbi:ABC transporter permease subunit [Cellulomonas sp. C5510]|uniref:ABC transporter permease subunit n=1 Tax=Cellulomonas sp. C5510 TaxID=2871170 RepID=UPI001C946B11|nr:ABC transporter permease subunit [Cellulomonas sp. C5510]QZN86357.1 ABC transporter permease subunit [Cellulomonas sp. C5510]
MSATATVPAARRGSPHVSGDVRVTFPRLVRSEWIKLWTVRSTWWVLPITVLAMAGIAWMVAYFGTQEATDGAEVVLGASTAAVVVSGLQLAQLAICVLAVLTITGEYTTGMIRSTLTAAPTRTPALLAKALVVVVVAWVTGLVATLASWAVTYPVLGEQLRVDLDDAVNQRILVGAPLYLAAIALLAYGIGALLRHSAGALATVLGLLLVVESVFALVPWTFFQKVSPYLPMSAGSQLVQNGGPDATLSPWEGFGVLVAWGVVALAAALVLAKRRDA